jgi:hypothetical protein
MEGGTRDSICSERSLAFINDLLTAPVYKRLALSALRRPRPLRNSNRVPPSTSIESVPEHQTLTVKSPAGSVHQSYVTVTDNRPPAAATTNVDASDTDLAQLAVDAATGWFSSSAVTDCDLVEAWDPSLQSRWLPLQASVKRGSFTIEEQSKIDEELLNAVESGTLLDIAKALDAGADINAAKLPEPCKTPLQVATATSRCCSALSFLLKYKNANLYVRDSRGRNLLYRAVGLECGKCIQSLLDVGLSMTDEDYYGYSAFNLAVESCFSYQPLLALLMRATDHGVMKNGVATNLITDLDPGALRKACYRKPIRRKHARLLVQFGWSLMAHIRATSPTFQHILKEEPWLLTAIIEHPRTVAEIREKDPVWDDVLIAATRGPHPNTAVILQCLRAGIEHQHLKTEICDLAIKEQCYSLLIFVDQAQVVWHESIVAWQKTVDQKDLDVVQQAGKKPTPQNLHELDAVDTQIDIDNSRRFNETHDASPSAAAEDKAKHLAQLALAQLQNLRTVDQLFQEEAWAIQSLNSSIQASPGPLDR